MMTVPFKSNFITKEYTINIEDNLYECIYHTDVLNIDVARNMVEYRHSIMPTNKIIVFADLRKVRTISKEARDYLSQGKAVENVIAAALLANSISARLIFNFFLNFNKPPLPIKLFQTREEALKWLNSKTFKSENPK